VLQQLFCELHAWPERTELRRPAGFAGRFELLYTKQQFVLSHRKEAQDGVRKMNGIAVIPVPLKGSRKVKQAPGELFCQVVALKIEGCDSRPGSA